MQALRYEQLCRDNVVARREHQAREAALALRKATPDWVDLDRQLNQLQLEAEMDAMEACVDERRPKIPVLDKSIMAKLRASYAQAARQDVSIRPPKRDPTPHPDVKVQADLLAVREPRPMNENTPPPPGGKNWKYESINGDRRPEDDWRNWE
jgi:hypothetical protein